MMNVLNDAGMNNSMYFLTIYIPEFMISSIQSMKATFVIHYENMPM